MSVPGQAICSTRTIWTGEIADFSTMIWNVINVSPEPNFLIEYLNWVYLNDPANGIHVFDIFGTYFKTIPLTGLDRIQIRGNNIYFFKDGQFQSYNMKSFEQAVLEVPEENPIHVRKEKKRLYVQTERGIDIYRISTKE